MAREYITLEEQLRRWVAGDSVHRLGQQTHANLRRVGSRWRCADCGTTGDLAALRAAICPTPEGECCPDFSCCRPSLAIPLDERAAIADRVLGQQGKAN